MERLKIGENITWNMNGGANEMNTKKYQCESERRRRKEKREIEKIFKNFVKYNILFNIAFAGNDGDFWI